MDFTSEKWGGRPHYRGASHVLGTDEHGTWVWGPAGRTIYRGDAVVFTTQQDALTLFPSDSWWSLSWWLDHPEIELYVNINTVAVWEADRVMTIDLDLDVVRWLDGRVEIVDRDEFELHQRLYEYPPEIIAAAEEATAVAFDLATRNVAPFDGVAAGAWAADARVSNHSAPTHRQQGC